MSDSGQHEIRLSLSDDSDQGGFDSSVAADARTLLSDLQQRDVRADFASSATRSLEPSTIALLISASSGALSGIFATVQAFAARSDKSTLTIETEKGKITLSGKQDAEEQAKLISAFREKYLT